MIEEIQEIKQEMLDRELIPELIYIINNSAVSVTSSKLKVPENISLVAEDIAARIICDKMNNDVASEFKLNEELYNPEKPKNGLFQAYIKETPTKLELDYLLENKIDKTAYLPLNEHLEITQSGKVEGLAIQGFMRLLLNNYHTDPKKRDELKVDVLKAKDEMGINHYVLMQGNRRRVLSEMLGDKTIATNMMGSRIPAVSMFLYQKLVSQTYVIGTYCKGFKDFFRNERYNTKI